MSERTVVVSAAAPKAIGPYSQGVAVHGFIFLSGQLGIDPNTGMLVSGGIREETEQALQNMKAVLKSAELDFSHVVKTTVFLADIADFAAMNEVYARYFSKNPPARSAFQVAALPKGARVEIEAIAAAESSVKA